MSLITYVNDTIINNVQQFTSDYYSIQTRIPLPAKIKLEVSNKDMLHDTIVDSDNNIIEDKYIHLISGSLGKIPINDGLLYSMLTDVNNPGVPVHPYLGNNGTFLLEFESNNVVKWHFENQYLVKDS